MYNKSLLFLFLAFLITACNDEQIADPGDADTYVKLFGSNHSDIAYVAKQTPDGGTILLGTTEIDNEDISVFKIKVIKVDENGNKVWQKIYPKYLDDKSDLFTSFVGRSIIIVDDGYIIVGDSAKSNQSTNSSLLLLKLNDSKSEENPTILAIDHLDNNQNKTGLDLHGIDILQDSDGNYRVVSTVRDQDQIIGTWFSTIHASSFTFDPNRDCFYDFPLQLNIAKSFHQTNKGKFIFGGTDKKFPIDNAILYEVPECPKTLSNASSLLVNNPQLNYTANQIIATKTGYAMIGTRSLNENNVFFSLLESNGVPKLGSLKIFEDPNDEFPGIGTNNEKGSAIANTADGGFIIAGTTISEVVNQEDILLVKTDAFGNIKWSKIIGNVNQENASYVQQTSDGGYLIFGNTKFGGIDTMALIKTDKNGNIN